LTRTAVARKIIVGERAIEINRACLRAVDLCVFG
jgi:hypothetical protein